MHALDSLLTGLYSWEVKKSVIIPIKNPATKPIATVKYE